MSRRELGAGLLASKPLASWITLYGGARALFSWISLEAEVLGVEVVETLGDQVDIQTDAVMPYLGGTLGLRVGYREVWLSLELTAMRTSYAPTLLGEQVQMRGWLVSPAIGLSFLFL